jgi:hypothetical protein
VLLTNSRPRDLSVLFGKSARSSPPASKKIFDGSAPPRWMVNCSPAMMNAPVKVCSIKAVVRNSESLLQFDPIRK